MDSRLILVKSIVLLYRESLLPNKTENSNDIIRVALESIKFSDVNIDLNQEKNTLIALKQTTIEMCDNSTDHIYEKEELLHRLKMNCGDDEKFYELFFQGIDPDLADGPLKRTIINIRKSIHNHFREQKVEEILSKAAMEFKFRREKIKNVNQFVAEICGQLEPFQVDAIAKDPAIVSDVDIGDEKSTSSVFTEIKNVDNGSGMMHTGFQGFNRLTQGGFRRGEFVMISALQHNNKTGFTLNLFKQIALYNKPYMIDATKKPLLLRISFEDDITTNLQWLYQSLKENETGQKAIIGDIPEEEMSTYVKEKLQVNGFHVKLMRVDPTQWSYRHICNKVLELEAEGYEIHLLMLDYLAMVPTTGCSIGPMGSDLRDMFRRLRNFSNPKRITVITPHQLSTEAKMLIRDGRQDFVKMIPNLGYHDKCRTLDNELDLELYIHIEKVNGKSFLTIQRGKHRGVKNIPDAQKYMVLAFHDVGGLRDDINGTDTTLRKPGGGVIGGPDEIPFFSFESQT